MHKLTKKHGWKIKEKYLFIEHDEQPDCAPISENESELKISWLQSKLKDLESVVNKQCEEIDRLNKVNAMLRGRLSSNETLSRDSERCTCSTKRNVSIINIVNDTMIISQLFVVRHVLY